jgi:hypothetical protein
MGAPSPRKVLGYPQGQAGHRDPDAMRGAHCGPLTAIGESAPVERGERELP